jgi:hypothetical protein
MVCVCVCVCECVCCMVCRKACVKWPNDCAWEKRDLVIITPNGLMLCKAELPLAQR